MTRLTRQVVLLLIATVVSQACDSKRAASTSMSVWDSTDAVVVVSLEARWKGGAGWSVSAQPVQSIGVRDGDPAYQFFDVSAAARQRDGDLIVADAGARSVRLYDPDGVFKKHLGGSGSGPGEFQDPRQILVHPEDSIFVWDDVAYRVTKYDSAGNFVGVDSPSLSVIASVVDPPLYPGTTRMLSSGELLVRLVEKRKDLPTAARFRLRSGALRVSHDLETIDVLMRFGDTEQVSVDSRWGPLPVVPAFAKNTSIVVQPGEARVCIGDQEGPEVRCFEPDGSATALRWAGAPIAVRRSDREFATWREATVDMYGQKLSADEARRLVSRIPVPAVRPEYSDLVLDRLGNLWVRRGPTTDGRSEAIEYLVFDRSGALLGSLPLPPIRILEIGMDYIIGVHEDDLGVQYVQTFEIVKPASVGGSFDHHGG